MVDDTAEGLGYYGCMTNRTMAESSWPDEDERRGGFKEFPGRVALAAGVIALFYAAWLVHLPAAAEWTGRVLRIAPRMSVFALGVFTALALQGCWLKNRVLIVGAALAGLGFIYLQSMAGQFEILKLDPGAMGPSLMRTRQWVRADEHVYFHARIETLFPGAALLLLRFESVLFAAVLLGTWIGRGAWSAWHFVTLLMFGAVCDVWLNCFPVAESGDPSMLAAVLRLPFVPALGGLSRGPAFTDIVFASAVIESGRAFRMHTLSLVLGALAGYCSGSFLGLEPSPAWTHLSMPLMACGVLAAAWPDLKMDSNGIGKMFLAVALLILALASLVTLQRKFNPAPQRRIEDLQRMRDLAIFTAEDAEGQRFVAGLQTRDGQTGRFDNRDRDGPATSLARPLHLTL